MIYSLFLKKNYCLFNYLFILLNGTRNTVFAEKKQVEIELRQHEVCSKAVPDKDEVEFSPDFPFALENLFNRKENMREGSHVPPKFQKHMNEIVAPAHFPISSKNDLF